MTSLPRTLVAAAALAAALFAPGPGHAQPGDAQRPRRMPQGQMQRLLDDYTLKQAQAVLKLDDAQYGQFQPRLRALQETRRRNQMARMQVLRGLSEAASAGQDAAIRERLQALQEHDARAATEVQQAYAAIDAVLDLRQQARFRVFEETMERRKLELMMRARQGRGTARSPRKPG